ncbi:uncharacterized protein LAESUDRAFT_732928 [Laetiporus sulphureus 93-53]|uniref:Uncharacterized protein n=1 Tax=Laetiporus sulphureus 93-53 TaxID=1314785 RepID=A0A165AVA5_9APHY|nr:uncharacterized protein LAESUDRAFT_732928 [Laetiporus sulphureus 93-53]KZS99731.1 hypothetical protein LAESUDRAFT_732928 [Laetiporus sulphureus 93-53]
MLPIPFDEDRLLAELQNLFMSNTRATSTAENAAQHLRLPSSRIRSLLMEVCERSLEPFQTESMATLLDEIMPDHDKTHNASHVLQCLLSKWKNGCAENTAILTETYCAELGSGSATEGTFVQVLDSDAQHTIQRRLHGMDAAISNLDSTVYDIELRASEEKDRTKNDYQAMYQRLNGFSSNLDLQRFDLDTLLSSSDILDERVLKLENTLNSILTVFESLCDETSMERLQRLIHKARTQLNACFDFQQESVDLDRPIVDGATVDDVAELTDLIEQYITIGRNLESLARKKIGIQSAFPLESGDCELQDVPQVQTQNDDVTLEGLGLRSFQSSICHELEEPWHKSSTRVQYSQESASSGTCSVTLSSARGFWDVLATLLPIAESLCTLVARFDLDHLFGSRLLASLPRVPACICIYGIDIPPLRHIVMGALAFATMMYVLNTVTTLLSSRSAAICEGFRLS